MPDSNLPLKPPRSELVEVAGDQIIAVVIEGDGVAVPLRLMCDNLGIVDVDYQVKQLREHPVYSAGIRMVNVRIGNRVRSVAALLHTYIPAWLNSLSPGIVNDETRPKLLRYQAEIVDILSRIYLGVPAPTHVSSTDPAVFVLQQQQQALYTELRALRDMVMAEQRRLDEQHQQLADVTDMVAELHDVIPIGPKEAAYIQSAIKRIAQRAMVQRRTQGGTPDNEDRLYQLLFGQFKAEFRIPRYDALPRRRYMEAVRWLEQQAAHYLPGDTNALPPHQERLL